MQIIQKYGKKPFLILISCLLSLRTKDTISLPVSLALFEHAQTPQELLNISIDKLENIIYKTGFFRQKAQTLHMVARQLLDQFDGIVPQIEDELLLLKGVGRKTANLVLGEAFGIPALCVDTHVHRISNRLGLVNSKTVEQTEQQLQKVLPKQFWIEWNRLLVMWGQNICLPINPRCRVCPNSIFCLKRGVKNKNTKITI